VVQTEPNDPQVTFSGTRHAEMGALRTHEFGLSIVSKWVNKQGCLERSPVFKGLDPAPTIPTNYFQNARIN